MSLSAAFSVISSSFAANSAQTAVVANNIANVNTPAYSRGDRECRDQFLRRRRRRVDHSRGQRGAPRAGLELYLAGRDTAGDFRRAGDAGSDCRRQLLGHFDFGAQSERRLALGDARQSANRACDLRSFADLVVRRQRCRVGRLRPRLVAQQRERDGPASARAG